jgi:hypothetical protein
MGCDELRHLLSVYADERDIVNSLIAAHIRSCPVCARGITNLVKALILEDSLTCEECLARLPDYYEATHPAYALPGLPDAEMAEVALHLGRCVSCHEQYEILTLFARMDEEEDELADW